MLTLSIIVMNYHRANFLAEGVVYAWGQGARE
jgi:hypothetical protein